MNETLLFCRLTSGVHIRQVALYIARLAARGMSRVCDCTLFRGHRTKASERCRAWSGPDCNGLTKALTKRRRVWRRQWPWKSSFALFWLFWFFV